MKNIYILILAFIPLATFTQNFEYSVGRHVEIELAGESYTSGDIYFKTVDNSGITFNWKKVENTLPAGWDYSLCDYTGCYSGVPESGIMTEITDEQMANGIKGFFKLSINPIEISGSGHVIIYVYDQENEEFGDTVSFTVNFESTVGILESQTAISIYPNPARDVVVINNQGATITSYFIQNLNGQVVSRNTLTPKSKNVVDLSDLPAGIYFITITGNNGEQTVKKLIVN